MIQSNTPLVNALKKYNTKNKIAFHIPAHRQGKNIPDAIAGLKGGIFKYDLTEVYGMDDLHNPQGVIADAQRLAAKAYGSLQSYFLVNGSSAGIKAMILATTRENDILIVPRNAHRSVLAALILSGAHPAYMYPEIIDGFGIAGFVLSSKAEECLENHQRVSAMFMIHPTYYGITSSLAEFSKIAHDNGIPMIVDEAHGGHFYFHDAMPEGSLNLGADLVVQSMHKTSGALTQASILHLNSGRVDTDRLKWCLQMLQSTSPSYLLMASLDAARSQMALKGEGLLEKSIKTARYLREKLSSVEDIDVLSEHHLKNYDILSLDETRLLIKVSGLGLTGYQVYELLAKEYDIQVEMADHHNILVLLGIGASNEDADALYTALIDIKGRYGGNTRTIKGDLEMPRAMVAISPRKAFMSRSKAVSLIDSVGEISACSISVYPPGVPAVCPGEVITSDIVEYLIEVRERQIGVQCSSDSTLRTIEVLAN